MQRSVIFSLLSSILVLGVAVAIFLRKSESDRIRDDLEALVATMRFENGANEPRWASRLRDGLTRRVVSPMTVRFAPESEARLTADELVGGYVEAVRGYQSLGITLSNIGVKVDDRTNRATAKGELYLDFEMASRERRGEPRRFSATLEKMPNGWQLIHAEISEPRIDQPEARP